MLVPKQNSIFFFRLSHLYPSNMQPQDLVELKLINKRIVQAEGKKKIEQTKGCLEGIGIGRIRKRTRYDVTCYPLAQSSSTQGRTRHTQVVVPTATWAPHAREQPAHERPKVFDFFVFFFAYMIYHPAGTELMNTNCNPDLNS